MDEVALGSGNSSGSGQLCIGLRSGDFQLIDVNTGLPTSLLTSAGMRVEPVACVDVPCAYADKDGADREWLICFNQVSHL